jgi:hypothetical protein
MYGSNGNFSSNMRLGNASNQNKWPNDRFEEHNKNFDSGYIGNGSNGSGSASFQSNNPGMHSKGKQSYYEKKQPDSYKQRQPNSGPIKTPRSDINYDYNDR